MVTAYLAHAFEAREIGRVWQQYMQMKYLWLRIFNPFYDGPEQHHVKLADTGKIPNPYDLKFDGKDYMHYNDIVNSDLDAIKKSDVFIILLNDSVQFGSPIEYGITWAKYADSKAIYVCALQQCHNKLRNHPWGLALSTDHRIYNGLQELEEALVEKYGKQNNVMDRES